MKKLWVQALTKYLVGLIFVGILIFLPAGTFHYPGGWLFMGILFGPMLILGAVLLFKAPKLLEKRLGTKEKEAEQKKVISFSALCFLLGFIVTGLDHRFGWTSLPHWITVTAAVVMLISYGLYAEVMRENAWLSRTVEVQEGQKVVDTGLYGIVRHPMYAVTIWLFLAMPLVLGSLPAFVIFLFYPAVTVKRIRNEEAVLDKGLADYAEYKQKVKWRLMPFIW